MGNNMEKEVFDREIAMCRDLFKNNGGKCNWGECDKCGAIPLLSKLFQGKIYEDKEEIKELKRAALR